jgi:hypothetical protein
MGLGKPNCWEDVLSEAKNGSPEFVDTKSIQKILD